MTPTLLDQPGELPLAETDQAADQAAASDYGVNNRDLPEQLKQAIIAAVKDAQQQELYVRRQEILQDANHRFYDMGIQHIYQNKDFCWTQATPGGSYYGPNGEENFGEYIDDYDIFHPFALIQQAKLSENMPGIDFQPVDPNKSEDIEASGAAEGMRHEFDRNNDIKTIQKEIVYHLQMGGRVLMWTRTADVDEMFGDDVSGRPQRTSTATLYGTIEAKVPLFANKRDDFWYAILYDDPDIKNAKTKYPWIAKKLSAGHVCLAENAYERIARLGVIQGSQGSKYGFRIGDSIAHLISRANAFLRLSAFESMDEAFVDPDGGNETTVDEETGVTRPIQVKEKLAQVFPDGVHAVIVGDEYAESFNKSMDDCLSIGHAFVGKGQSRMPIMKSMVVVQDRFNSSMNQVAETNDFCIPSTYVSCDEQEFAAIKKQRSSPGAFRNLKQLPPGVTSVAGAVYSEPGKDIPKSFQDYIEFLIGALPQFQLSVPPSIWGEAMADQKTAAGYQLAASQAMGILGVFWVVETQMLSRMYYHNCLAIMNDPDYPEQITIPGDNGQNVVVRKASLTKGDFRAYPDTESGFPETTAAKRGTLTTVITQLAGTPLGAQVMGSPDNVALMVRDYGVPELVIPEAVSRDKQLREIETLLGQSPILAPPLVKMLAQGAPVPSIMAAIKILIAQGNAMNMEAMKANAAESIAAQATGQPPPPAPPPFDPASIARSSVPVWESDYHVWEAKKCRDWLSSDARNTEETIGRESAVAGEPQNPNIAGILNVVIHMKEHDAFAAQEAPPVSGPLPAPNIAGAPPAALLPPGNPAPTAAPTAA